MRSKLGLHSLGTTFACPCGTTHNLPIEACHTGPDAAHQLADFARTRLGKTCLVVSDKNTRHVGGEAVLAALSAAGKQVTEKVYPGTHLDATEELGDEVARLGADADFFVAIGSGTITDLAKHAGTKNNRPALVFPTAASMNGYTSAIVAIKVRGLKRTVPCTPALGIFADPAVVATAPAAMTAAGVGDFLSKCSSSTDWRAAYHLRGGYYCDRPREFVEGIEQKLLDAAPAIGKGETEAVAVVLEALILSGLSMLVAGSSAPASGGEHLISHYLDMKHALYNVPNDLHGAQVGVATIHCLRLWESVLALDPDTIDVDKLVAGHPSPQTIHEWIETDWGPVAPEVIAQWTEKALDPDELRDELQRIKQDLPKLRADLRRDILPSETVSRAIQQAGGPTGPDGLKAPPEEYEKALRFARFLRNRFTILDLAAELGIH